jgi:hypothetical protein
MKILDSIKLVLGLLVFSGFFYLLTDTIISEYETRKTYYKIEFSSGRIYWADSVNVISQKEVSFIDIPSKRKVTIYGQFVISTPKK